MSCRVLLVCSAALAAWVGGLVSPRPTAAVAPPPARLPHGVVRRFSVPVGGFRPAYALSADGRTLAVTCPSADKGRTYVFDLASYKLAHTFAEEPGRRTRWLALSADGEWLATSSQDSSLTVREVAGGAPLIRRASPRAFGPGRSSSVAFSPGEEVVACPSLVGHHPKHLGVHLWEVLSGRERAVLGTDDDSEVVTALAVGLGGRLVVIGTNYGVVRVWDRAGPRVVWQRQCFPGVVHGLTFAPSGDAICACGQSGASRRDEDRCPIQILSADKGKLMTRVHAGVVVTQADFSPNGRLVAAPSATRHGGADLWDAASGERVATLDGHPDERLLAASFTPDGRALVTGGEKGTISIWDLRAFAKVWEAMRNAPALARPITLAAPPWSENSMSAEEWKGAWAHLADDALKAERAVWKFALRPRDSLPTLKANLRPAVAPASGAVARWVARLDSEEQDDRERASAELARVAHAITPQLRKALTSAESPEVKKRLTKLVRDASPPLADARLRPLRAVEALAHMRSAEADALLRDVAKGAPDAHETKAARAALARAEKVPKQE